MIAPFEVKPEQPILLIRPDRREQLPLSALSDMSFDIPITNSIGATGATRTHYAIDFANEHAQLELGTFQKSCWHVVWMSKGRPPKSPWTFS